MRRNTANHAARVTRAVSVIIAMSELVLGPIAAPAFAQVRTVDPNTSIDADLAPLPNNNQTPPADAAPPAADPNVYDSNASEPPQTASGQTVTPTTAPAAPNSSTSYQKDDLIGAAEGVFGKGAQGLAGIIEKILKEQGQPNAYIAGREASGALVVGLRYGSGTLTHKVEGKRDIYWTGPSVGFDAGGNAGNTFVLVYNLYDTQDIYRRFPAGEGAAYFVGGFNASYLRRGDIVLIPIRLGVGYRLGVNAGYMKFTEKRDWVPF
jgi:hypothetical protein